MSEAIPTPSMIRWRRMLLDVSPQNAFLIRFGVVVTASMWIGKAPGLVDNSPTWILITSLVLIQPTSSGSMMKGLLRAAGTIIGAFTSIVLFGLFSQNPPMLMLGILIVQVIAAYGFSGARFKYAWFVWAFTTAIVLGGAMTGGEAVETVAFQRASAVGIGILIVFVVDSLFWPSRSEPRLRELLAARAHQLGDLLQGIVSGATRPGSVEASQPALASSAMAAQLALIGELQAEIGVSRSRADALMRCAFLLEAIASRTRALVAPTEALDPSEAEEASVAAARSDLARRLASALDEVADALREGRDRNPYSDGLDRSLLDLEGKWDARSESVLQRSALESRFAYVRDLIAVLRAIEAPLSSESSADPAHDERTARGLFDWRPDPFRTKVALRTGLAVVAALLTPLVLGWPLNTMVAPLAFMMAALNRGAVVQTLTALALAVAAGWLVADLLIVFVTPVIDQVPLSLLLAFALAMLLAYIPRHWPKLAMLPTMGGLVAVLSVFGGPSATTNVQGSYDTVSYIALGSGVGWLFSQIMWPATALGLFRHRVAQQLASCLEALGLNRTKGHAGRPERTQALIRGYIDQSTQLAALHGQARLEPVEHSLDEERRTEILALMTEMMDAVLADRTGTLEALHGGPSEMLHPLMDAIEEAERAFRSNLQGVVDTMRGLPARDPVDLDAACGVIEERLAELRRNRETVSAIGETGTRAILVEIDSRRRLIERQAEIDRWMKRWV